MHPSQALTVKEKRRAAKAYRKRNESRVATGGPEQALRRSSRILKQVSIYGLRPQNSVCKGRSAGTPAPYFCFCFMIELVWMIVVLQATLSGANKQCASSKAQL